MLTMYLSRPKEPGMAIFDKDLTKGLFLPIPLADPTLGYRYLARIDPSSWLKAYKHTRALHSRLV